MFLAILTEENTASTVQLILQEIYLEILEKLDAQGYKWHRRSVDHNYCTLTAHLLSHLRNEEHDANGEGHNFG